MRRLITIVGVAVASIVIIFFVCWQLDFSHGTEPVWGATFSQYYATVLLKIDWRAAYEAILNELPLQKLRLIAYWEDLEPEQNKLNFGDLDWQVNEAQKRGKDVVLVIGYRVPRWPECHAPGWAKQLNKTDFQKSLLIYLGEVVNHYKSSESIVSWQVENEPFLSSFGECPTTDANFLKDEVKIVKSADTTRPVIVTASGELSLWTKEAQYGDIVGTTLYRIVWNPVLGKFRHFIPPAFYTLRAWVAEKLFHAKNVIITELQAEPWAQNDATITNTAFDKQTQYLNTDDLAKNVAFAKRTGLKEIYLWGPEWWYYREENGDPSWMEFGKTLK